LPARKGCIGAEQVTESIGYVFEAMLALIYRCGGVNPMPELLDTPDSPYRWAQPR